MLQCLSHLKFLSMNCSTSVHSRNHLNISFAPIGLLDMLNFSCAVEQVEVHLASDKKPEHFDGEVSSELTTTLSDNRSPTSTIALKVKGCGWFGAFSTSTEV
ncbi:hypothetical protein SLE2022_136940 [Rubroshorea leprosula]